MKDERKRRMIVAIPAAAMAVAGIAGVASAAETVTYSYDALGRVVTVERVGNPASAGGAVTTSYAHDRADNRTTKTTTGSANAGPP